MSELIYVVGDKNFFSKVTTKYVFIQQMMLRCFKMHLFVMDQIKKVMFCRNLRRSCSWSRSYSISSQITAGVLIIGDEILKGVRDVNTPFLIEQLNAINVKINKITILPDNVDAISSEVYDLSSKCSFVITSGGVGPTHDDVTYEAVAKAYSEELVLNNDIFHLVSSYFGPESRNNPGILKYSRVPKSADLNYVEISHNNRVVKFPVISVRNVFIFPGVPALFQKSFMQIKAKFLVPNKIGFSKDIYIDVDEFSITAILNAAVEKYCNHVKFGSYPTFNSNYFKVKLSLESQFHDGIEEACKFLYERLPEGSVVNVKKDILSNAYEYVNSLTAVSPFVSTAVSIIEEAIKRYTSSELCLCFNGGKDCTALLYALYSCIQHLRPNEWTHIHFLYVRCGESFNEVETFIQNCTEFYQFNLTVLDGQLKHCVSSYLKSHPNVKAMLMGTRKCDPGATDLLHFCTTDCDWPSVTRVLPLLDWTYSDVWFFLRKLQIPYCILYDRGYTSLGNKLQTIQNPLLSLSNHGKSHLYKPAYMLQNPENERKSRL